MALLYESHDVFIVGVVRCERHETRHAVDVAADAGVNAIEGYVLCVCVHDYSSALADPVPPAVLML